MVIGTNDDIFTQDCIDKIKECKNIKIISVKDANRYLESPEDITRTLEILREMVSVYTSFFKE